MVVIAGAGPAGLATAYELQRRGLPYRVLERNGIGEAWRNHYDRLHLHTLKQLSGLPGMPMPRHYPRFPSAAQFQSYLEAYAQRHHLNITCGVDVQKATPIADGWQLETSHGLLVGDMLVAATGIWSTPVIPQFNGADTFGGPIIHSRDYRNAAAFRGKRVLVVGVGNSGSEIAVDLSEHGAITAIAIRNGATFVPYPRTVASMRVVAWLFRRIPRTAAEAVLRLTRRDFAPTGIRWPGGPLVDAIPVVGFQLPNAVGSGQITRYGGIERFVPGGVRFSDGRAAPFDAVVLATGFRPSIQFIEAGLELDSHGRPRVDCQWRSVAHPHLFCVGFDYPTTEGWIQAISRVAGEAAQGIATTLDARRDCSQPDSLPAS